MEKNEKGEFVAGNAVDLQQRRLGISPDVGVLKITYKTYKTYKLIKLEITTTTKPTT